MEGGGACQQSLFVQSLLHDPFVSVWPDKLFFTKHLHFLMLGKIEHRRKRGQQRMRWLDDITDSMDMSLNKLQENLAYCSPWSRKELDTTEQLKTTQRNHFSAYFKIVFKRKRQSLPPSQIPSSFLFRVLSSLFMQVCPIMMVTMPITYLAPVK